MLLDLQALQAAPPSDFVRRQALTAGLLASWSLVAVLPLYAAVGLQQNITPPPPRNDKPQAVVATWPQPDWPVQRAPWTPNKAASADPVVPGTRQAAFPVTLWPAPNWPVQTTLKTPIPAPVASSTVPYSRAAYTVLPLWDATSVTPLWQSAGVQTGIDRPTPPYTTQAQQPLTLWEPLTWPVQTTRKAPIPTVVAPPSVPAWTRATAQPLALWSPVTWDVPPVRTVPQPRASDAPPARILNQATYDRWYALDVTPLWHTAGYQNGAAVAPGDNPPVRYPYLAPVYAQWEPRPLQPVWFNRLIDLSALMPSSRANLTTILATWAPVEQPIQRRPVVTASGPNPPPPVPYRRDTIALATSWLPVETWTAPPRALVPAPAVAVTPPVPYRRDTIALAAHWASADIWTPSVRTLLVQPGVDILPFQPSLVLLRACLDITLRAWDTGTTSLPPRTNALPTSVVFRRTLAATGTGVGSRKGHH